MYKDGILTISEWQKGMADSPYVGFANISNVDVFDTPYLAKISNRTTDASGGTSYSGLCIALTTDIYGNTYQLFDNGSCYKNYSTLLQSGLGTGWDMIVYKDYLWVRHSTVISLYGPLSVGPTWNGNVYTGLNGNYYGKMIVDENPDGSLGADAVYLCNGNTIATIRGFTSVASPGTLTTAGLTLPEGEYAVTFEKIGNNLHIGTQKGSYWSAKSSFRSANIYTWDKSISNSFRLPVKINECGIQAMIADNNRLYVVAGTRGNVYVTDTTNYAKIKRIPWVKNRNYNQTMQVYPNALKLNLNGNLLIGTSTLNDSFSATNPSQAQHGIYEISTSSGYPVVFKHQTSPGYTGSLATLKIGSIFSGADDSIIFGWQSGTNYGIDQTDFYTYSSYSSVIESALFRVGTRLKRKIFQNLEFTLSEPLVSGQAIRISWRGNLADNYSLIGTFDYTSLGSVISHNTKALIDEAELVQVKIELTNPAYGSQIANTNVKLLEVKIW